MKTAAVCMLHTIFVTSQIKGAPTLCSQLRQMFKSFLFYSKNQESGMPGARLLGKLHKAPRRFLKAEVIFTKSLDFMG